MPVCINDSESTYKGTEPSPKGLGYCAHAEEEDTVMEGLDGNMWIIKDFKGVKRWIKHNTNLDELFDKMYNEWWLKLGHGGLLIVYNDNYYEILVDKKRNKYPLEEQWEDLANDDEVDMIIWSAKSTDVLYQLVEKIIKDKELTKKLLKSKDTLKILLQNKNKKKYFSKYYFLTNKDYAIKL